MRFFLIIFILFFSKISFSETFKPIPSLLPDEVISIQLIALQNNDIPYKNAGILFWEASAEGRSEDGAFAPSWGVPWGPPRPPKEVLKIRGGHQSSRQLESLHFYGVP